MEETPLPAEFGDAAFLLKTGWTPDAYDNAPDDLVRRMTMLINAEAEVGHAKMQEAESKARARK